MARSKYVSPLIWNKRGAKYSEATSSWYYWHVIFEMRFMDPDDLYATVAVFMSQGTLMTIFPFFFFQKHRFCPLFVFATLQLHHCEQNALLCGSRSRMAHKKIPKVRKRKCGRHNFQVEMSQKYTCSLQFFVCFCIIFIWVPYSIFPPQQYLTMYICSTVNEAWMGECEFLKCGTF